MKFKLFVFHQSHTVNSKANWLAVFVSEFCFSKINFLLEVINALSQTCINTHWLYSNQKEGNKALVLYFFIIDSLACRLWRCSAIIKLDNVNKSLFRKRIFCEVSMNTKAKGLWLDNNILISLFIFFVSHILWASLEISALPSGFIPPHCEIQCTLHHLNRSRLNY